MRRSRTIPVSLTPSPPQCGGEGRGEGAILNPNSRYLFYMDRIFFVVAGIMGALGVMLGAFGAHALREQLSAEMLSTFETAVRYHLYHALALLGAAVVLARWPDSAFAALAGWLFLLGIVLFSGSLYALALSGVRWLGAITPFGGLAFIAGWVCLALAAWRG